MGALLLEGLAWLSEPASNPPHEFVPEDVEDAVADHAFLEDWMLGN